MLQLNKVRGQQLTVYVLIIRDNSNERVTKIDSQFYSVIEKMTSTKTVGNDVFGITKLSKFTNNI